MGSSFLNFLTGRPQSSQTTEVPGLYNREEGAGYARRATGMTGQPLRYQSLLDARLQTPTRSPYEDEIRNRLTGPASFAPVSDAEKELVRQAMSERQGTFSALGIGASPGAQSSIAAAAAPTLAGLRQQGTENLFRGQQLFSDEETRKMDELFKGMGIDLQSRGLDINALMDAAKFALPQLGNEQTGARKGLIDFADTASKFMPT